MFMIEGKTIAKKIKEEAIEILRNKNAFVAIVSVGNNESATSYTHALTQNFESASVDYAVYTLEEHITQKDFDYLIETLENTDYITAIFLHRPLPKHLKEPSLRKDLDNPPCTATAVIEILKAQNIEMQSKNCLIIGRSEIVGKPLSRLLLDENATVTIAHSYTKNLQNFTKKADIIIVAVGKANFITGEAISENAVVIDVGINYVDGKLTGDCDFQSVITKTPYVTPVPGGVGPVTSAVVLANLVEMTSPKKTTQ